MPLASRVIPSIVIALRLSRSPSFAEVDHRYRRRLRIVQRNGDHDAA
jgi:hypothetical protein